jgi:hypothetical protein
MASAVKGRQFSGLIDAQLTTSSVSTVDRWNGGYPVVAASRRTPSSPALIRSTAASSVNPDRAQQHGPFPADQGMVTRRVICPLLSQ